MHEQNARELIAQNHIGKVSNLQTSPSIKTSTLLRNQLSNYGISESPQSRRFNSSFKSNQLLLYPRTLTLSETEDMKNEEIVSSVAEAKTSAFKDCFPSLQLILDLYGSATTKQTEDSEDIKDLKGFILQNAYDYKTKKRKLTSKLSDSPNSNYPNKHYSQRVTKGSAFRNFLNKMRPKQYRLTDFNSNSRSLNRTVQVSSKQSNRTNRSFAYSNRVLSSDKVSSHGYQ